MNIDILSGHLRSFVRETKCQSPIINAKLERTYDRDNEKVRFSLEALTDDHLEKLREWLQANTKKHSALLGPLRKVNTYVRLQADPVKSSVKSLEGLVVALKNYIKPSTHKWIFHENSTDGMVVPWYVKNIEFVPARRNDSPPFTRITLEGFAHGANRECFMTWNRRDLEKIDNVMMLLSSKGYYLETPEAVKLYLEDVEQYRKWQSETGKQFLADGMGTVDDGRWYDRRLAMTRDGRSSKVVMDDLFRDEDDRHHPSADSGITTTEFWVSKAGHDDDDFDDEISEENAVTLPLHPYVKVFDLEKHTHVDIHVRNLRPYQYDRSLSDKLVLPEDVKSLAHILMQSSSDQLDDIVSGKTGGTIVIATGPPGTGKTLTAEVFSESIGQPLYVIQCSQLGTDEESLEKRLSLALSRATRWKAILLIDEADVYIHERGTDVQQNAIVGVFLRTLEYYRGILFMTSNRAVVIDDAIMSRATAWIQYEYPSPQESILIWKILADQFKIDLSQEILTKLGTQPFGQVSGRNIKNLLKLGKRLASAKKVPLDLGLLHQASRFLALNPEARGK